VGTTGAPIVTTNHEPFTELTTPIFERVARRTAVVAISQAQAATAPSVPIAAVVHHGIEVEDWPFGAGDGGYLLFLGRMHPEKEFRHRRVGADIASSWRISPGSLVDAGTDDGCHEDAGGFSR
jgi:hypothetical protein